MAQQLATLRTPEAYAGVAAYAHSHTGEAAAAAYLALGHAYLLDKRYAEAESALARLAAPTESWPTTQIFSTPRRATQAGDDAAAENILHGFTARYPESIFDVQEPELEANVLLALNKLAAARQVLAAAAGTDGREPSGFSTGEGASGAGARPAAGCGRRPSSRCLLAHPLSAGGADGARQAHGDGSRVHADRG